MGEIPNPVYEQAYTEAHARIAELEASTAPKVKALEWITPSPTTDGQWQDMNGLYDIDENILFIGHVETGLRFDSEADAKAAAQSHYDALILGALEPAPARDIATDALSAMQDDWNGVAHD
ncbi:MAG: hypothetical protein ACPGFA_01165 [Pikeienuella sp.]